MVTTYLLHHLEFDELVEYLSVQQHINGERTPSDHGGEATTQHEERVELVSKTKLKVNQLWRKILGFE